MGGCDYIGVTQQRVVPRRLFRKHVQSSASQFTAFQSIEERRLVDQLAPGHVDQTRSRLD